MNSPFHDFLDEALRQLGHGEHLTSAPPAGPYVLKQSAYMSLPHELAVDIGLHACTPDMPCWTPPYVPPTPTRRQRAHRRLARAWWWVSGLRITHRSNICDHEEEY